MDIEYYTEFEFILTDGVSGSTTKKFNGVIKLNRPLDNDNDMATIEEILAKNFEVHRSVIKVTFWSRIH